MRAMSDTFDRRAFLQAALAASGATLLGCAESALPAPLVASPGDAPVPVPRAEPTGVAILPAERARPKITHGVQSGDVTADGGIVWARADRLARMVVEWDTDPRFGSPRRVSGPVATSASDFTARVDLVELPPGERVHYRVIFEDPDAPRTASEPVPGSFMTAAAPNMRRDTVIAWSGDTAGQGWGINLEWGGMKTFEAIRRAAPDLFIHCGDIIYADSPIPAEIKLVDGGTWKNVTTEAKSKVAETLDDFRGNYAYNLLDENVKRMNAEVASYVIWDDHEVHNNWFPGEVLEDKRYTEQRCRVLMDRARQAMIEYTPARAVGADPKRVYRSFRRGPLLDVFLIDERSYRNDNGENRERDEVPFLGAAQLAWLKGSLAASTATWKVIASGQPLSLAVAEGRHGTVRFDAWANKHKGPPAGRELELANLLRFLKQRRIRNVVFVTADVHYCAAIRFDPRRAAVPDFDPFWEFVAGPLHANTYGPNPLDPTFGPVIQYRSPSSGKHLRSPADGGQYFGTMKIDARTSVMTVSFWDLNGLKLHSVDLPPVR